jgi:hypothetical protein
MRSLLLSYTRENYRKGKKILSTDKEKRRRNNRLLKEKWKRNK